MDQQMIENLNPTFLFTWKGTRYREEKKYHSHDYPELAYVLSGQGRYRINGEIYPIREGDLLILNPGTMHQALAGDGDQPATEFFIGFSDVQFHALEPNCVPLPEGRMILHTSGELKQRLFRICSSMDAEKSAMREGRYFMLKAYLMQILVLILRETVQPVARREGQSFESVNRQYVVEQIVSYFEDHYSEKISLDSIAGNMYLSPFYISRIFKSETGDTPIHHLIKIRLEKAREILESDRSLSVQQVAAAVGYEDAYHFSKLFKKHYGLSPSQVRAAR